MDRIHFAASCSIVFLFDQSRQRGVLKLKASGHFEVFSAFVACLLGIFGRSELGLYWFWLKWLDYNFWLRSQLFLFLFVIVIGRGECSNLRKMVRSGLFPPRFWAGQWVIYITFASKRLRCTSRCVPSFFYVHDLRWQAIVLKRS